ncbi:MAG: hydrogenase maturation protein [Methyloversatilis sp.]|uniref:hydrogenase maturation protein n=1 Tax=Methyloversatilis sp. TaxID=2569862 RepID=UPI0025CD68DD|nr:hydrogenase maturation protein [Methyloversatilis sp.]MCR6668032.1 hydrogenase maturation protein [Methyloversatilis sp.]
MTAPLRILLLCHSFNSLSQRLYAELTALGHTLSVELDIADAVTGEAIALFRPDLVLAPFLKRRIPESVWRTVPCFVVHPGPPGDRGPAALDWAIVEGQREWGVTVLQADGDFDAGPVWGAATFPLRAASKGAIYRREVTEAAVAATLQALARFTAGDAPQKSVPAADGWRGVLPQARRAIDWLHDDSATVLAKVRASDGQPGVVDALFGRPCRLFDAHPATQQALAGLGGVPGDVLAQRDGALLRRTVDGGVWIGRVSVALGDAASPIKLPATQAFAAETAALPEHAVPLMRAPDEWAELRYTEHGERGARVGVLNFDFCNGAMSTAQCQRLRDALVEVKRRDTQVLLIAGGDGFFSNGIDLNCIEAAAHRDGDSAADESWRNINAMNDVALEIITCTDRLTVSLLRGNAGAGGAFLALAADEVWAQRGVMLNPHYKNMGNLYGSEYWTYLAPRRLGADGARALMQSRLPLSAPEALRIGFVDRCLDVPAGDALDAAVQEARLLAASYNLRDRVMRKQTERAAHEAERPLADYRKEELSRMHRNFYGFDPSYHVARHHFVHKLPHAWTPRHLAVHREVAAR